jgi:hypothetical protein
MRKVSWSRWFQQKRDILAVVMRGSLRAALVGLSIGVVLAAGAARLLRGVLYGLSSIDAVSSSRFGISKPDTLAVCRSENVAHACVAESVGLVAVASLW